MGTKIIKMLCVLSFTILAYQGILANNKAPRPMNEDIGNHAVVGPLVPDGDECPCSSGQNGATGATGPAGAGLGFAFVPNLTAITVAIEADVIFSEAGIMTPEFTHAPSTSGITINNDGTYMAFFSVSGAEPNQFAFFINGVTEVPFTVYGSGAGTQQNTGLAVFTATAGDVLTLRNHSSAAAVTLASVIGGTQANTNASVVIQRVA